MKPILRQTVLMAAAAAVSIVPSARAEVPATCVKGVDLAKLGPKSIVGQGPHGEKAASPEVLALSEADAAKIKEKHFKVGISMQTVNLDWSQLQIQGITDTLKKYGVTVTGVASAEYQVDKQIAVSRTPSSSIRTASSRSRSISLRPRRPTRRSPKPASSSC
ncbi:ribose transport system substrate-binding protein [Bradyrhizobium shewense]|uniref:Ribose transport system substrate-binding protein n=1 Tax=Bradyrhizobium shewense TaxID=1761772 RepID=A0A1C3TWJ2_9BRAD|nr:hypothetical protein [Bradyrhizobium shewense]SCB07599.1 ribose transport system substrate-binding protein [Bradyrhizobium shewense]